MSDLVLDDSKLASQVLRGASEQEPPLAHSEPFLLRPGRDQTARFQLLQALANTRAPQIAPVERQRCDRAHGVHAEQHGKLHGGNLAKVHAEAQQGHRHETVHEQAEHVFLRKEEHRERPWALAGHSCICKGAQAWLWQRGRRAPVGSDRRHTSTVRPRPSRPFHIS